MGLVWEKVNFLEKDCEDTLENDLHGSIFRWVPPERGTRKRGCCGESTYKPEMCSLCFIQLTR